MSESNIMSTQPLAHSVSNGAWATVEDQVGLWEVLAHHSSGQGQPALVDNVGGGEELQWCLYKPYGHTLYVQSCHNLNLSGNSTNMCVVDFLRRIHYREDGPI